ncbi:MULTISPECIES: ANTAR domain-containing response regulator [Methylobacillus]|uniref:Response regulator receiver (CheY-like) and ANTAR domain protein n=1 Tax=Methylobacillus flagellatus (strain ATCC 51484 / DSM 6875 / VKM B-1610 / KT) TaxID=265072 RepID=Q1H456_METFK|nr:MULTISPECIES: ANTAR domain-containing protein [Methylobacillus]ABE48731.1 response regulator receiver (CheY-like) and ANTAR domain protein [Methylobacillus flagellatus KT]MPS49382.1 ANTAR domain-containing protein [Methylobacillus sp.]
MASHSKSSVRQRSTLDLFRNLRNARVAIFHPKDDNRDILVQQLQRIGCQTVTIWPPLADLPEGTDIVFFLLNAEASDKKKLAWLTPASAIPLIGIVEYENPTILDTATSLGCHGILVSPVHHNGILSTLIMAIHHCQQLRLLNKRNQRLEQKLQASNQISAAQAVLARTRDIGAVEAYKIMREQAMLKRVPIEEIARAILHADGILHR